MSRLTIEAAENAWMGSNDNTKESTNVSHSHINTFKEALRSTLQVSIFRCGWMVACLHDRPTVQSRDVWNCSACRVWAGPNRFQRPAVRWQVVAQSI